MKKYLSKTQAKQLALLFCILSAVSGFYMILCIYAGWSRKIAYFQQYLTYLGFRRLLLYPRWFLHSTFSGMTLVLCLYILYRLKSGKKHYLLLLFGLALPYFAIGMLTAEPELTLIMIAFTGAMFAFANLPSAIRRSLMRRIGLFSSEKSENTEEKCQQMLRRIEWLRFYPLKKIVIGGLWLFALVIGFLMTVHLITGQLESDAWLTSLFLLGIAALTSRKAYRYLLTPYHCIPALNKLLSKKQLQSLLSDESFAPAVFEHEYLKKYVPILVSENWILAEGMLFSRKLTLATSVYTSGTTGGSRNHFTNIRFFYLNGDILNRSLDIFLNPESEEELRTFLYGVMPEIAPDQFHEKLSERFTQIYASLLPDISDSGEKMYELLTRNITEIRQTYKTAFAAKTKGKKKSSKGKHS